jgi:hypothetical protein
MVFLIIIIVSTVVFHVPTFSRLFIKVWIWLLDILLERPIRSEFSFPFFMSS